MYTKLFENEAGWGLTLIVQPGRGASLSLYKDGRNRLHQRFAYHAIAQAEKEAEAYIELGGMVEVHKRVTVSG